MVFLRPIVLRSAAQSSDLSIDRYDFINTPIKSIDLKKGPDLPKINNFVIDKKAKDNDIIDLRK